MILLKLISWPYVRRHRLRWFLTLAGIVLGVAVFVGMHTANQSVLYAFRQTVDRIAGATQLQVSAGETGFDENVLARVQSIPQIRVAVPVIQAVVSTGLEGQGNLLILGVDMTGDRGLRDYDLQSGDQAIIDDPLVFLAQPDSLMITETFARENHLVLDSTVPMKTMEGEKRFTVRGIMKSGGLTSAFGGNLAIMDVYAAQKVFGRGRKFDRIDIAVKQGASVDEARRKIQGLLGSGFQVEEPSARGQQFESISHVYSLTADITSAFALFIGMFIIYNTFQIAVAQRRSEIGILRALGATRGQIRTIFLAESAIAGLFGSCLGLLLGIAIARAMTGYIGALLGEVYGIAQRAEEISTDPKLMLFAVVLGVITSVIAAFVPARGAARVDPVQALQKGKYQQLSAGENRARRIAALVLAIPAFACVLSKNHLAGLPRRCAGRAGDAAPDAIAGSVGGANLAAFAQMAAAGRRNARGRQLAASAAPHFGRCGCADVFARAGRCARRPDARQLRFHFQMAERRAESGSFRDAVGKSDVARLPFSGFNGRRTAQDSRYRRCARRARRAH